MCIRDRRVGVHQPGQHRHIPQVDRGRVGSGREGGDPPPVELEKPRERCRGHRGNAPRPQFDRPAEIQRRKQGQSRGRHGRENGRNQRGGRNRPVSAHRSTLTTPTSRHSSDHSLRQHPPATQPYNVGAQFPNAKGPGWQSTPAPAAVHLERLRVSISRGPAPETDRVSEIGPVSETDSVRLGPSSRRQLNCVMAIW